jgi:hypothetical protein
MRSLLGLVLASLIAGQALFPRAYGIRQAELTTDEAFSWRLTQYPVSKLMERTARDVHPPLHYLLLKVWVSVFGDSPAALRGLSVLVGVLTVMAVYLLVRESVGGGLEDFSSEHPRQGDVPDRERGARWAPLFAASVAAGHWSQVIPARSARMYALGAFLAALSSWLLLRALRAQRECDNKSGPGAQNAGPEVNCLPASQERARQELSTHTLTERARCVPPFVLNLPPKVSSPQPFASSLQPELFWSAYGVVAAALLYTHNYGIFTVVAQAVFVFGDAVGLAWRHGWRTSVRAKLGFVYAMVLAATLYSPWLHVLYHQTAEVRQGYWTWDVTRSHIERVMWSWATGTELSGADSLAVLYAFLATAIGWAVWSRGCKGRFFLVLWLIPWSLSIGFSLLTGRSIFLERCLVFAHIGWIGFLAILFERIPGRLHKSVFAWVVSSTAFAGLLEGLTSINCRPSAIVAAMDSLQRKLAAGDVVLVDSPNRLNTALYYAKRAGMDAIDIKAPFTPTSQGHQVHVASLEAGQLYSRVDELAAYCRLWTLVEGHRSVNVPGDVDCVFNETHVIGNSQYILSYYERR